MFGQRRGFARITLVVSALSFGWVACDTQEVPEVRQEEHGAESAAPVIERVDENGVLHFGTSDDFFKSVDVVAAMSPRERDAWEERIGFLSQRRLFDQLARQLEAATTEAEYEALLSAHADIAQVDGEELQPRIPAQGYAAIVNRDGLFYAGGILHKVTSELVISSEDGKVSTIDAVLASLKPGSEDSASLPKGVRVARYTEEAGSANASSVPYGCTDSRTAYHTGSDRKLDFTMRTFRYYCAGCCGQYYYQVRAEWQMVGYKKNLLGKWVSYNTTYDYRNVAFEISVPRVTGYDGVKSIFDYAPTYLEFAPGSSGGEYSSWTVYTWLGDQVQNTTINEPYFVSVKGQATSRGIGDNWAGICCGFSAGCGF
jgi:hypothetical protein